MPVFVMRAILPYREYLGWMRYLAQEPDMRDILEIQLATLSTQVSGIFGGKSKFDDFLLSKSKRKDSGTSGTTNVDEAVMSAFAGLTVVKNG